MVTTETRRNASPATPPRRRVAPPSAVLPRRPAPWPRVPTGSAGPDCPPVARSTSPDPPVLTTIFKVGAGAQPTAAGSAPSDARARDRRLAARLMAGDPQALTQVYAEWASRRVVRD